MIAIDSFIQGPQTCPYLPERQSTLEYLVVTQLSSAEYETRMNEGWRKFGPMLFRPVCDSCKLCRPMRVATADFKPTRSQKRNLKTNSDLEVLLGAPDASAEHIELYNRYHAAQNAVKEWPQQSIGQREYILTFLNNPVPAVEISVRREGRLLGTLLADVTTNSLSLVYHFYDPDERPRGLGTLLILKAIEAAQRMDLTSVYLGYFVEGSSSMAYKKNYEPNEILDEVAGWQPSK